MNLKTFTGICPCPLSVPYSSLFSASFALAKLFSFFVSLCSVITLKSFVPMNPFRYHLQAFRHLYVLAAEPRVLVPREVDTNKACHVPLEVTLKVSIEPLPYTINVIKRFIGFFCIFFGF